MKDPVHQRIIESAQWIEDHLWDDFDTGEPAHVAGLSFYHYNRLFKAMTGLSPGLYIRRRRLSEIARRLAQDGEKTPLIELALEAGYETQSTFTRAFKLMFGITPDAMRRSAIFNRMMMQPPLTRDTIEHLSRGGITQDPVLKQCAGFDITGPADNFEFGQVGEINTLWQRFIRDMNDLALGPEKVYGASHGMQGQDIFDDRFRYTAGLSGAELGALPKGWERTHIPAGTYAVFVHNGPLSTVETTIRYIWQIWVPQGIMELAAAPDFEVYDSRFDPDTGTGEFEIWLPIKS